ncbi:hypothetical protein BH24CHL6_BH24CHL6_01180 [soil metagenome]
MSPTTAQRNMVPNLTRQLLPLLAILPTACLAQPPPPPTPSPTAGSQASPPAATPSPAPAPTPNPTPAPPSPSPSPAPLPTPSPGPSPSPDARNLAERHAELLQATLDEQLESRRIPGAAAVVTFADGSRWSGVAGPSSLRPAEPVSAETGFVVGSITKTFVTALVLQLADEGVLELDGPLARWLPDYPRARRVTLRQLLSHTSGVFNHFEHPQYESLVFGRPSHEWAPQEILDQFRRPAYFAPGEGFHYSNTGFVLLGMVIEEATESSLGDELRRRFFEPLGLNDTYFQAAGPQPGWAHGYLLGASGHRLVSAGSDYRPSRSAASVAWAAGAVVSTAEDIAVWVEALYGGDVLTAASRAQLMDYRYSPHPAGTYALGTRTRLVQGARAFGHTGSLRGYMAAMWHFAQEEITVVVLTNLGRYDGNRLADRLVAPALLASGEPVAEPPDETPAGPAESPGEVSSPAL